MTINISGTSSASSGVNKPYPAYRGLRLEEDIALKNLLTGIVVPTARGESQRVPVFFRDPEREERIDTFPYIMIEPLRILRDPEREHRGYGMTFGYEANTGNPLANPAMGDFPIPITINYQISTVARNNQHDVMINDILATSVLPFRFGALPCPSGTLRRLDVQDGPAPADSLTAEGKRLFRKIWVINVSAEITPDIAVATQIETTGLTVDVDPSLTEPSATVQLTELT